MLARLAFLVTKYGPTCFFTTRDPSEQPTKEDVALLSSKCLH